MSEPTSNHPRVSEWLAHIRALAVEIGPRGPTRPGEQRGAEYARAQFEKAGLSPTWETFKSARSIFHPHILAPVLMLVAFAIFPLGGRLTAAVAAGLTILVLASELLELGFKNNPIRMVIPKGKSQNVHAVILPRGEHRQDLVLMGHVDTQRTPLIFRTPRWVKVYDRFTTLAFAAFIFQAVIYTLAVFFAWPWVWYASIFSALTAVVMAAMFIEAESTPFTAGANDNATAVGMVLTLARQLAAGSLEHTRVYAVVTGCEEVQHYGAADFYRRHRSGMKAPKAVVFEMLGCAGPAWMTREGIIVPFKSDPALVAMAERLGREHPEWKAYPTQISGGNTELADAVRNRVPAITLFGLKPDGEAPYWHQVHDIFDKMDPDVMERTWEFTLALVQEIDRAA